MEWLESTFYQQGFAQFPAQNFQQLGLSQQQISDLTSIGSSEQQHVVQLQSAIAQAGTQPVQPCTYNFGFTDAAGMVSTAAILENVGVSAYLGAAPLVSSSTILGTAGSILTVEARHQTFVRAATNQAAVPQAFDSPLSPKMVFSLAAPFITSCPQGSNLELTAFPNLTLTSPTGSTAPAIGQTIQLQADSSAQGGSFCAFTTGGNLPGGTSFSNFTTGQGCVVPQGVAGITYVTLTNAAPLSGLITDDIIVAGVVPITFS